MFQKLNFNCLLQVREDLVSLEQLVSLGSYTTVQPFDQRGMPWRIGDPFYSVKTQPGGTIIAARVLLYMGDERTDLKALKTHGNRCFFRTPED